MKMMSSFQESLVVGKESEKIVLNRIKHKYPNAYIKDGYFKDYDIFIPEIDTSVEVKKDFKSQHTGNVVIEIQMNGKLSALSTTKADWWVFHLDDEEFIFIKPEQIRNMIHREKLNPVEFVGKGDFASKIAYLVKKDILFVYGNHLMIRKLFHV